MGGGNHGFFCNCRACHRKYSTPGGMLPGGGRRRIHSVDDRMDAAQRRARAARQAQPTEEVGGGDPCEDCHGSTDCNACEGVGSKTLDDGTLVRCQKCLWRIGKCYACRGTGKERPTHYRRD